MNKVRTRFAPSPTGFMHVGNLRTALYSWLLAKSQNGSFVLRIEDTDRERLVADAVSVIYKTLKAAGLTHDEGPDNGGEFGPYVQSERLEIYRKYAEELVKSGHAYYCFCDKTEEESEEKAAENSSNNCGCPGGCRNLTNVEIAERLKNGAPYVIRQRIPQNEVVAFDDLVFGHVEIETKVLDEQILLKRDGYPTYNFANVVDDHLMEISHVVRGSEYLSSTPKYNLLYRAFGWEIPQYVHLPLIMGRDANGEISKLSKRHGSVSFENLVAEGYLPEAIVNYIALLGWSPKNDREVFSLSELAEIFNVAGLNKSPAVFDYDKLRWMNAEHIKAMAPEKFAEVALPFSGISGTALESGWAKLATLLQPRTEKLSEIPEKIAFLLNLPEFSNDLFFNKKSKCTPEIAKEILTAMIPEFESLSEFTAEKITELITAEAEKRQVKLGLPMWAVRIALSGTPVTPGGPGEIMEILGKAEALKRLNNALARL